MEKEKRLIVTGERLGRLTIGDLVRDVQNHELFLITPMSYTKQGRLREVYCDCGQTRLVAESILATGRLQSCGCLRAEIRSKCAEGKMERMRIKQRRQAINSEIKIQQVRLKSLQIQPVVIRDEKAIDDCSAYLRRLFAQKASLSRKLNTKTT